MRLMENTWTLEDLKVDLERFEQEARAAGLAGELREDLR